MPPPASSQAAPPEPFQPFAGFLAILFPGLGHFYLGRVRQGVLITCGVIGLYAMGVLIGGISCIDRRDNFVWFLGQALVGPLTLGLDQYHQNHLKVLGHMQNSSSLALVLRSANPDEMRDPDTGRAVITVPDSNGVPWAEINGKRYSPAWPPYVKSIARTNELGTLFTTIAGFLNVIVIIDAAWNRRIDRKRAAAPAAPRTLRVPGAGA